MAEKDSEEDIADILRKRLEAHKDIMPMQNQKQANQDSGMSGPYTGMNKIKIKILASAILIVFLSIAIFMAIIFLSHQKNERKLSLGYGFGEVVIQNDKLAKVYLNDSSLMKASKIEILFHNSTSEFKYRPNKIKNFYKIKPDEIGLQNFKGALYASISIEYKTGPE